MSVLFFSESLKKLNDKQIKELIVFLFLQVCTEGRLILVFTLMTLWESKHGTSLSHTTVNSFLAVSWL